MIAQLNARKNDKLPWNHWRQHRWFARRIPLHRPTSAGRRAAADRANPARAHLHRPPARVGSLSLQKLWMRKSKIVEVQRLYDYSEASTTYWHTQIGENSIKYNLSHYFTDQYVCMRWKLYSRLFIKNALLNWEQTNDHEHERVCWQQCHVPWWRRRRPLSWSRIPGCSSWLASWIGLHRWCAAK